MPVRRIRHSRDEWVATQLFEVLSPLYINDKITERAFGTIFRAYIFGFLDGTIDDFKRQLDMIRTAGRDRAQFLDCPIAYMNGLGPVTIDQLSNILDMIDCQ